MKKLRAHPVAELFPMLPTGELADMAADIAERGLLQPITVCDITNEKGATETVILDGRNRYAACALAKVEPQFTTYDGDDPSGYALAVNITRRSMTKGQQAIVVARACLESKQTTRVAGTIHGISAASIAQANVILDYAPDLADGILTGATAFDPAYAEAQARKKTAANRAKLVDKLRDKGATKYLDLITDGTLTIESAYAAYEADLSEDEKRAEEQRKANAEEYTSIANALLTLGSKTAPNLMDDYNADDLTPPQLDRYYDIDNLERAANFVAVLIDWRKDHAR